MDQDAFRKLLSAPKQNGLQHTPTRGPLVPSKAKDGQKKSAEGTKSAFKPRKVKKQTDSGYRDRAAERRTGVAGDFAEVESVLEAFEKHHANEDKETVEERRQYLGGDAEHTVLVKGLDFALLEQAKARMAASSAGEDDEELEEAFRGAVSASPPSLSLEQSAASKKRTREDIVRELRNKRAKGLGEVKGESAPVPVEDKGLEEAKREGKFKPIGFKPIGSASSKSKDGKEAKKKKKKKTVEDVSSQVGARVLQSDRKEGPSASSTVPDSGKKPPLPKSAPEAEPEPVNEDFDIFADAGEYEGINLGDDDEDSDIDSTKHEDKPSKPESRPTNGSEPSRPDEAKEPPEPRPRRKWIDDDEPPSPPPERSLPSLSDSKGKRKASPSPISDKPERGPEDEAEPESSSEKPLTRLAPLASSAVPSIRDILAADSALEAEQKRKARKEKRKRAAGGAGGGGSESEGEGGKGGAGKGKKVNKEAKLNREYQKLKSYTEKKGGGL